ncbi:hypothetical protein [Microbulbifer litoralis]|uniref:hypothetical protein n=1 Tax=Microbulbifer litoralis TaxID=2933965 RepID=UPI002028ED72|nr:hypothetical protein [Microbulbifer sp. GX H0434]
MEITQTVNYIGYTVTIFLSLYMVIAVNRTPGAETMTFQLPGHRIRSESEVGNIEL